MDEEARTDLWEGIRGLPPKQQTAVILITRSSGPVLAGAAIRHARSIIECRQSSLLGGTSPTRD
jgi:hypothetical protein